MATAAAGGAAASLGLSTPVLIGAIVVVIVLVAGAALMLSHGPSGGGATTSVSGSGSTGIGSGAGGSGAAGSGSSSGTGNSGGASGSGSATSGNPGQVYLSQNQYAALLGTGGAYNSSGEQNASALGAYMNYIGKSNSSAAFLNNVTAAWEVGYTMNSSSSKAISLELVFQASNAKAIYTQLMNSSRSGSYNVTNATLNGMTYDYVGFPGTAYFAGGSTALIGYKDNYVVFFYSLGGYASQSALASDISGDLP